MEPSSECACRVRVAASSSEAPGGSRLGELGQSEIEELDAALGVDHDVAGLEIAVHDAGGVRLGQRAGDLDGVAQDLLEPHAPLGDELAERLAVHVLHGDEVSAVLRGDVVDGDDIGIVEGARRPAPPG